MVSINQPDIAGNTSGYSAIVTNGYVCGSCGQWVTNGLSHLCNQPAVTFGYLCPRCGQWLFGNGHVCNPPVVVGTFYPPVSAAACQHCYCIDVPPSGERTKEHNKCCKCADVRAVVGQ